MPEETENGESAVVAQAEPPQPAPLIERVQFEPVTVEYVGQRSVPARVLVYHEGRVYNGQGYIFGGGARFARMTRVEAQIITGDIPPVVEDSGKVSTGFVINIDLGANGLTGETWRIQE